mgnify:CR=1 FL=1
MLSSVCFLFLPNEALYSFETGEQVFEQNAYQPVENMTLDIGHLSVGQYILHIKNEHNTIIHQIMMER